MNYETKKRKNGRLDAGILSGQIRLHGASLKTRRTRQRGALLKTKRTRQSICKKAVKKVLAVLRDHAEYSMDGVSTTILKVSSKPSEEVRTALYRCKFIGDLVVDDLKTLGFDAEHETDYQGGFRRIYLIRVYVTLPKDFLKSAK